MERVWIALGATTRASASPPTLAATAASVPARTTCCGGRRATSRRSGSGSTSRRRAGARRRPVREAYRVRIEAGGTALGSIWALRDRALGEPDRTETRLLAAAADQIGQALAQDRLAAESQAAEIARQSDALKSALLQSVSHDLRTPLATIRAAAGHAAPGQRLERRRPAARAPTRSTARSSTSTGW